MTFCYKIFISSTYEDLIRERKMAMEKILKLQQFPSCMELFPATGKKQWEYIKNEIDKSDYFILILAGKYGSLHESGISYTELEYNYAREKGKHIIVFLVKDIEALPNKNCETDIRQKERLLTFRNKLKNEAGLVAYWTDAYELGEKIGESLSNVMRQYPAETRYERKYVGCFFNNPSYLDKIHT